MMSEIYRMEMDREAVADGT